MYIVAVHNWRQEEPEAAKMIADVLGILVFEARQKIIGGGPVVLASFADPHQAERISAQLSQHGVPAFVIDSRTVRNRNQSFFVGRFGLGEQALQIELVAGGLLEIDYGRIELLLVASCSSGQAQAGSSVTKRKFSLGKTLLAGGVPLTKKVKTEVPPTLAERDQTLWLFTSDQKISIFDRAALDYTGLGEALQISRDLNFNYLKNELRRRAPQAGYDDRLLRRGELIRVLGQPLNPENDLDLAFEVLARCMREKCSGESAPRCS